MIQREGSLVPFVYEQKPENAAGSVQRLGFSAQTPNPSNLALGLDAVAHGAEAGEGVHPLVARRAGDDAQRGAAGAEADPLHDGHRSLVLAADAVDPGLKTLLAVDADRLGHGDAGFAHAGDLKRGLLGEAGAIVSLLRGRAAEAEDHERLRLIACALVAVGEDEADARR